MYSLAQFKGSDIGLRAYELAAKAIPDLRLVMFGHDAPPQPLGPQVQFTRQPPQEKLREIYAQCDAWLFTSRLEGFGLPLLEAMACRTPVIATPAGAAPELLAGGGGILVKPEDPQDMANAITAHHGDGGCGLARHVGRRLRHCDAIHMGRGDGALRARAVRGRGRARFGSPRPLEEGWSDVVRSRHILCG